MAAQYWLVKQEPNAYSWDDLVRDKGTMWDGVRNFQARNNLRAMHKGDLVLFYHSVDEKRVVGVAKVAKEHYPDPTADEGDWSVVDVEPVKAVKEPVTLARIKEDPALKEMALVRNARLSVSPVTASQFRKLLQLAKTKI